MIKAEATIKSKNAAECRTQITGSAEAIAVEYASITTGLLQAEGGQIILDRAMDIIEEINEHEEKRSK